MKIAIVNIVIICYSESHRHTHGKCNLPWVSRQPQSGIFPMQKISYKIFYIVACMHHFILSGQSF